MPRRPWKQCSKPGCPNLTIKRFCADHEVIELQKESAEINRRYNRTKRDVTIERFYKSAAWLSTREAVLNEYNHIDLYDFYVNQRLNKADTVHHIIPLKENWSRRLDKKNLFPISISNHNVIDVLYRKDKPAAQQLLFSLLDRWKREMTPGGV